MSGPQQKKGPLDFEIPDLDLPPIAPQKSRSGLHALDLPAKPAAARSASSAELELDLDALGSAAGEGPALDLDHAGPISRGSSQAGFSAMREFGTENLELDRNVAPTTASHGADSLFVDRRAVAAATPIAVAEAKSADWPTGETPRREFILLDPLEVRLLAEFGTPGSGPRSLFYALRVAVRRRALKAALSAIENELSSAERERDAALVEIAAALRPTLAEDERFVSLLSPIADIESLGAERGAALAKVESEAGAELEGLAAELTQRNHELSALANEQSTAGEAAAQRRHARERLEAREKRAFIEIRALEAQAAQRLGPAGGEWPADLAQRLAEQQSELAKLKPELDAARLAEAAAERDVANLAERARERERAQNKLERRRTQVRERLDRQRRTRASGLGEVDAQRRAALADVGRAVLRTRGALPVPAPLLARVAAGDEAVCALVKRSELHLRALDAADPEKVRSGLAWLLIAVLCLVGLLCYRLYFAG